MSDHPKRPAFFAGHEFSAFAGGVDPAVVSAVAHEVARSLLSRVRDDSDGIALARALAYVDEHGLDDLAQLWSTSSPHSLPGALWQIYVIRDLATRQAVQVSVLYGRGADALHTVDPVIAGAPTPAGPREMTQLADDILRGVFVGDFADALDRAAAFCRVVAAGCVAVANDADVEGRVTGPSGASSSAGAHAEQASALTAQALRLSHTAQEFTTCARLYRRGSLD